MRQEPRWPTEKDIKAILPDLKPDEAYDLGLRLLESAGKLKSFIEEVEKSSDITEEDLLVSYT